MLKGVPLKRIPRNMYDDAQTLYHCGSVQCCFFTLLSFTYNLHGKFRTAQKSTGQIAPSANIYTAHSAQHRNPLGTFRAA